MPEEAFPAYLKSNPLLGIFWLGGGGARKESNTKPKWMYPVT
jgi:hypothetical protein